MQTVQILSGIVFLICMVIAVPGVAMLVLGPVNRMAGRLNAPTRFQLSDFLWLLVMLQASLGVSVQAIGTEMPEVFAPVLTFLLCSSVALWAGAISFLSRAGVASSVRRGCFIILQLPGTLALMILAPGAAAFASQAALVYAFEIATARRETDPLAIALAGLTGVAWITGVLFVGWAFRWLSLWIVAESTPASSSAAGGKAG